MCVTKSTKSTKGTSKNKRLLYTAVLENPFKNRVLLVPLVLFKKQLTCSAHSAGGGQS